MYIYKLYMGGWGAETNREVSFRSCVRAAVCKVRTDLKNDSRSLFPFPFYLGGISSLFPWEIRCPLSLEINEIKGIRVRSSESK